MEINYEEHLKIIFMLYNQKNKDLLKNGFVQVQCSLNKISMKKLNSQNFEIFFNSHK